MDQNGALNYMVITNSFGRDTSLVERSLKASLNQSISPRKVLLVDQNKFPLIISDNLKQNKILEIQRDNDGNFSLDFDHLKSDAKVSLKDFEILRLVGEGGFGKVILFVILIYYHTNNFFFFLFLI